MPGDNKPIPELMLTHIYAVLYICIYIFFIRANQLSQLNSEPRRNDIFGTGSVHMRDTNSYTDTYGIVPK